MDSDNVRKAKMMFVKNGSGYDNTRIAIPMKWSRKLGFTKEDRECTISLEDNAIVIRKEF